MRKRFTAVFALLALVLFGVLAFPAMAQEEIVVLGDGRDEGIVMVDEASAPQVAYRTHVQTYGWQDWRSDGQMSGTSGESKRLEGIELKLTDTPVSGGITYRTHVQTYGWQDWRSDGQMSGTSGESKRLEAIEIQLTGQMANEYDVWYRVHAQSYGWMGWAKNGERAGTATWGKRLEAIQVVLIEKGSSGPGTTYGGVTGKHSAAYQTRLVSYRTHVQTYGWQSWVYDGAMSGTSGQGKRLEGICIKLPDQLYDGGIEYRTHVQSYGWMSWARDGAMSGTSGQAKRLEAIQIHLYGEMADHYSVWYHVHSQTFGWLGWAQDDQISGTSGMGKRLEAIEILILPKGSAAPGSTDNRYYEKTSDDDVLKLSANYDYSKEVISLVNQQRTANGLGKLTVDSTLQAAAMQRAAETTVSFSHTRPNGKDCFSVAEEFGYQSEGYVCGENCAKGQPTPESVVDSWMNSSGHRANILNGDARSIGVGCVVQDGVVHWVQLFSTGSGDGNAGGSGVVERVFTVEL